MENLVLYRKYRPKRFSEIVGQEHIVQTLTNAVSMGLVSHAYLFSGPRGSGKTTIARILAKAINCEDRKSKQSEPCNKCSSCIETNQGRAIDLIEIDAASNRGIDEIRSLRDSIRFAPTRLKYKVFVIDECHQLTKEAANALLKILEEPPSHAIFILATTEIHKMIATIISRCQRFDFRKLSLSEIVGKLEMISATEKKKIEKSALELIALNSGGAMRDAESLLNEILIFSGPACNASQAKCSDAGGDKANSKPIQVEDVKQLLGIVDTNLIGKFVDCIVQKKTGEAINFLNQTIEKGYDPTEFIKSLINYLRQGLILKINPDLQNPMNTGLTKEEIEKLQTQVANLSETEISKLLNLFMDAENKMKYASIPQLPIELAIVEALSNN